MNSKQVVRDYFDREAGRFDAIYTDAKPWYQRLGDRLFRRVIIERFRLICNLAPQKDPWTVLDVGCGSGRYMVPLAKSGAARLVGIDVAPNMIALAEKGAERNDVGEKCSFITAPFLDVELKESFDVILAIGYFDYLPSPGTHLSKMVRHCKGRIFISFPKRWEWRAPIRKLRFFLEGSYVRFYNRAEILGIAKRSGLDLDKVSLIDLGRDWIMVARVA